MLILLAGIPDHVLVLEGGTDDDLGPEVDLDLTADADQDPVHVTGSHVLIQEGQNRVHKQQQREAVVVDRRLLRESLHLVLSLEKRTGLPLLCSEEVAVTLLILGPSLHNQLLIDVVE